MNIDLGDVSNMKKFLITGSSGFVSRHFIEYLEHRRIKSIVKGIDVSESDFKKNKFKSVKFEFERIDLLKKRTVENIISKFQPDYILHLASYSSVAFSWKNPVISFQNNTNIFLNLLEALRKFCMPVRLLSIGSSEEYGNVDEQGLPLTEKHSLKPISPYAVARLSQELLSQLYEDGYGLNVVMTRSFNHIGPYQKEIFVISSFVKQLVRIKKNGEKGELITGDLSIVRDFIDVRDVVSAYYLLLTQGKKGNIYNVCSGSGFSLRQVVDMICKILNINVNIRRDPALVRPQDNKIIIGSNEKIRLAYGWQPVHKIEDSLRDMIKYWQTKE